MAERHEDEEMEPWNNLSSPNMMPALRYVLVAAIPFALSGCSYLCRFEARGRVREAATGQPIAGVKVELVDAEGHALVDVDPVTTNGHGAFEMKFTTNPSAAGERTGWKLLLTAKGFEGEEIGVGSVKEPKNANETVYLIFQASMRKARSAG